MSQHAIKSTHRLENDALLSDILWLNFSLMTRGVAMGGPRGGGVPGMDGAPPDESTYVRTQKCHVISTKGLRSFVYLHYIGIFSKNALI